MVTVAEDLSCLLDGGASACTAWSLAAYLASGSGRSLDLHFASWVSRSRLASAFTASGVWPANIGAIPLTANNQAASVTWAQMCMSSVNTGSFHFMFLVELNSPGSRRALLYTLDLADQKIGPQDTLAHKFFLGPKSEQCLRKSSALREWRMHFDPSGPHGQRSGCMLHSCRHSQETKHFDYTNYTPETLSRCCPKWPLSPYPLSKYICAAGLSGCAAPPAGRDSSPSGCCMTVYNWRRLVKLGRN